MIDYPFKQDSNGFAEECKSKLSGVNVSYEFYNIESSLAKVAKDMVSVLGQETYDLLVSYYSVADPQKAGSADGVDALQRAMLHFAFYHHLIFITVRIGNDGITVKKNDDETTAFKYQTDELKEKLVGDGWFWIGILYEILNANPDTFPDWASSDQNLQLANLPVAAADFGYWFGVTDTYFIIKAASLIRKAYNDDILPRMEEGLNKPVASDDVAKRIKRADVDRCMRRAVVYKVIALSIQRFDYFELPEPIRRNYNNEMDKNHAAQADSYIKNSVAGSVNTDAESYLRELEQAVQLLQELLNPPAAHPIAKTIRQRQSDKFGYFG